MKKKAKMIHVTGKPENAITDTNGKTVLVYTPTIKSMTGYSGRLSGKKEYIIRTGKMKENDDTITVNLQSGYPYIVKKENVRYNIAFNKKRTIKTKDGTIIKVAKG